MAIRMNSTASDVNYLLTQIGVDARNRLLPQLESVELPRLMRLESEGRLTTHIYFPHSGLVSVVASNGHVQQLEVALTGSEGMSGISVLLGHETAPYESFMQVGGHGSRVPSGVLRDLAENVPELRQILFNYVHDFMVQMTHTAVAHGRSTIEERLARWLLMADDRLQRGEVPVTHEFLALMLGVRRPGVTVALKHLEEQGPIRRVRSTVEIIDRDGLIALANGAYGPGDLIFRGRVAAAERAG